MRPLDRMSFLGGGLYNWWNKPREKYRHKPPKKRKKPAARHSGLRKTSRRVTANLISAVRLDAVAGRRLSRTAYR